MTTFFVVCAAFGGTLLVLQFLMTFAGLASDSLDGDVGHVGDVDHGDMGGHDYSDSHGDHGDHHDQAVHHGTNWLFRVLSFRTVIAAMAFFGIAGLTCESAGFSPLVTLALATAAGLAAMHGVYSLMQALMALRSEGTTRVQRALGRTASVYLGIPANDSGAGKIQINLQNRTVEYLARTPGPAIPTGATVVVTEIIAEDTVRVELSRTPDGNGLSSASAGQCE